MRRQEHLFSISTGQRLLPCSQELHAGSQSALTKSKDFKCSSMLAQPKIEFRAVIESAAGAASPGMAFKFEGSDSAESALMLSSARLVC